MASLHLPRCEGCTPPSAAVRSIRVVASRVKTTSAPRRVKAPLRLLVALSVLVCAAFANDYDNLPTNVPVTIRHESDQLVVSRVLRQLGLCRDDMPAGTSAWAMNPTECANRQSLWRIVPQPDGWVRLISQAFDLMLVDEDFAYAGQAQTEGHSMIPSLKLRQDPLRHQDSLWKARNLGQPDGSVVVYFVSNYGRYLEIRENDAGHPEIGLLHEEVPPGMRQAWKVMISLPPSPPPALPSLPPAPPAMPPPETAFVTECQEAGHGEVASLWYHAVTCPRTGAISSVRLKTCYFRK